MSCTFTTVIVATASSTNNGCFRRQKLHLPCFCYSGLLKVSEVSKVSNRCCPTRIAKKTTSIAALSGSEGIEMRTLLMKSIEATARCGARGLRAPRAPDVASVA